MGGGADADGIFSSDLNLQMAGLMSSVILMFTMTWSYGTRYIEQQLMSKPHYLEMLSKAYRELMILGFLSITLVLMLEFDTLGNLATKDLLCFEFAHLMLFAVAMAYILISVISTYRLTYTESRWTRTANMDVDQICDLLQAELDEEAAKEEHELFDDTKTFFSLWSTLLPYRSNRWEDVEWKLLRLLFLKEFRLGLDFDYSQYMHRKLIENLLHSLHIQPSTWGAVLVACLVYFGITWDHSDLTGLNTTALLVNAPSTDDASAIAGMLTFGWLLFCIQCVVLLQIKQRIHNHFSLSGCCNASAIPRHLRELDAHIVARDQVKWLPFFTHSGNEFLDCLVQKLEVKFFVKGSDVFKEGDAGESMFFICKGSAVVVDEATDQVLGELSSGDYTGEMSILLNEPRSKTVKCKTTCIITELHQKDLEELEKMFPEAVSTMREYANARKQAQGWDEIERHEEKAGIEEASKEGAAEPESHKSEDDAHKDIHAHLHGPRAANADKILSPQMYKLFVHVMEFTLLGTCFHFGYYGLHLAAYAIPDQDYTFPALVHIAVLAPVVLIVFYVRPLCARYLCLITNAIQKDNDMIALVVHSMDKVIALRNQIKRTLMEAGMKRNKELEFSNAGELAKFVFHCLDDDDSGELDDEFRIITRFMDPDQDQSISINEWSDFMMATEEELSHGGWQESVVLAKLQQDIRASLGLKPEASEADEARVVLELFTSLCRETPGPDTRLSTQIVTNALNNRDEFIEIELLDFERAVNFIDEDNEQDIAMGSFTMFLQTSSFVTDTTVKTKGRNKQIIEAHSAESMDIDDSRATVLKSELTVNPMTQTSIDSSLSADGD